MDRLVNILVVAAGGALGSVARYLVSLWTLERGWTKFPWATLLVNIAGSFVIMLVAALALRTNARLFVMTGILGGFTTYSSFDLETTKYFQDGKPASALLYVGTTLVACFTAGMLGVLAARLIVEVK